jgi:hypothetical protein
VISGITEENSHRNRLRANYRQAFGEWVLQVNDLQAIGGSQPGSFAIEEAEDRVASAELAYRAMRDQLTDDMANSAVKSNSCSS